MKALKEPLARLANKADGTRGTFWEARYKSVAILDTEELQGAAGAENIKGLISFVAMLALLFTGYVLVDSSKDQAHTESPSHGH